MWPGMTNGKREDRGIDPLDIALMTIVTVLASILGATAIWIALS
jgi:hypothetical protein